MVKRIMGLILTGTMIMSLPACGKANTDTSKTILLVKMNPVITIQEQWHLGRYTRLYSDITMTCVSRNSLLNRS